jgi:hypothetical protein
MVSTHGVAQIAVTTTRRWEIRGDQSDRVPGRWYRRFQFTKATRLVARRDPKRDWTLMPAKIDRGGALLLSLGTNRPYTWLGVPFICRWCPISTIQADMACAWSGIGYGASRAPRLIAQVRGGRRSVQWTPRVSAPAVLEAPGQWAPPGGETAMKAKKWVARVWSWAAGWHFWPTR